MCECPAVGHPPPLDVLTLPEVAEWLELHPNSVHRAARSGRLPARRVGKEWRFLREAVEARWTPGHRLRGAAQPPPLGLIPPESPVEMTAGEAAAYLRVQPTTIYSEASSGRLPAWKDGQEWRTTEAALRDYLRSDPESDSRYAKERASNA